MSTGAYTYDEVMNRIPWATVLMMVSDQGRFKDKKDKEEIIESEEEELSFLGL